MKFLLEKKISGVLATTLLTASLCAVGVSPAAAISPATVNLGSATSFAVLASTYATTGAPSTFNGNIAAGAAITTGANNKILGSMYSGEATTVGADSTLSGNLYSGAAITLGAGSTVSGSQYLSAAPQYSGATTLYTSAMSSMNSAITDINNRTGTPISGTLDGVTLTPGVYSSVASLGLTGILTLDAQGDSNAVFIIKSDSFLVTAASSSVVLTNQAQAKNVFWAPKGYYTAGADSIFKGNVLATTYVTIGAGTAMEGRLFSQTSYVVFGAGNTNSVFGITGIGTSEIATTGTVPSVLGLTEAAASTSLTNDGFSLGTVTTTASGATSLNNGQVKTQSATGAGQPFATPIDVVLYAYVAPATTGTVPSVFGLTEAAASTSLTNAGFTLGAVTTTASGATSLNNGQVKTQSATGAGQPFATPIDVVLYAYVAPATTGTVPSVLGLTEAAARSALTTAGFTTGTVTTSSAGATDGNDGQVKTQSATGANQLFATPINFVLYLDLTPPNGTVPSVIGLTEAAARAALIAAGFTTSTVTTTTVGATDDNTGQVVTQSATGVNQPFATPINFVLYLDLTPPNTGTVPSVVVVAPSVVVVAPPVAVVPDLTSNLAVYFKARSSVLSKKNKAAIRKFGLLAKNRKTSKNTIYITVTGSINSTKKTPNNRKLATARAKVVIASLKKLAPGVKFKIAITKSSSNSPLNQSSMIELVEVPKK